MRVRHPLTAMITGAVVCLALAAVIALLSGAPEAGQATGAVKDPRWTGVAGTPRTPRPAPPTPMGGAPQPVARQVTEPLIRSDFADPDMIKVGGVYYAYATNTGQRNLQIAKAPAIEGPWTILDYDGLPALGPWASAGLTWAPDVLPRPDGSYLLYYTARTTNSRTQCIGVAVARSAAGPFSPIGSAPLICPRGRGDTIDADAFTDDDGTRYLLYRSGSGVRGRPTAIFLQRMDPTGLETQGPAVRILTWNGIEPRLVEAPALVRRNGRYYLFYANGDWRDATYQTGYATASGITGPYRRAPQLLMTTEAFRRKIIGPGGADVISDETGDRLVFHGVLGGDPPLRGMYAADLGWVDGRPIVRGLPQRYEAESGRISGGQPRSDVAGASGGKVVGYRGSGDSGIDLDVTAPVQGTYSLRVRYANRATGQARDEVQVNGTAVAMLDYGSVLSKTWDDVSVNVVLRAGSNTLRIRRLSGQVDLDYLELI